MPARETHPFTRWWMMTGLAAFALLSYMARANISIAAEPMMHALGLTKIQMGQVFTSFLIGYAMFQIPGGALADRFGGRIVLSLSALLWFLTTAFTGLIGGLFSVRLSLIFAALWAVRFMLGVSEATTFPGGNLVVRAWMPPRDRALGNSIMFLGTSLASAAVGPLVSWLMLRFGWQVSFYVTSLPPLVLALIWALLARDQPGTFGRETVANIGPGGDAIGTGRCQKPLRQVLTDRNVLLLTLSYISEGYVLFIFVFWMYIYLVEKRGFSMITGGWIAAIPWLTAMCLTPFGGLICDRIAIRRGRLAGARVVIMAGYGASGLLLFTAAYSGSRLSTVASLALSIAFLMSAESSFWSSANHLADDHVGLVSGIMNTAGILGGIASTSLVPIIVQRFGWLAALSTGTVMALACALTWIGIREAKT